MKCMVQKYMKNMNVNFVRLVAVAAAMGGCVSSASADVSYTVGGTSDLEKFDVKFNGSTYNNIYAGGIQISQPIGSKDALPNNYVSVCTDFLGTLYVGQTYHYDGQAVPIASGQNGGIAPGWSSTESFTLASYLFNTDGDLGSGGMGTGSGTKLTVDDMAALQLAVWMVLYDTSASTNPHTGKTTVAVNETSGEFQMISGDAAAMNEAITEVNCAVAFVNGLTGNYSGMDSLLEPDTKNYGDQNDLKGENGHDPQELMIASVPEPATILAGVFLMLPLGVSIIRGLRKSRIA